MLFEKKCKIVYEVECLTFKVEFKSCLNCLILVDTFYRVLLLELSGEKYRVLIIIQTFNP